MDRFPEFSCSLAADFTRRTLILCAVAQRLCGAAEFWDLKPASEWTSAEIARLTTSSPWAVKTRARMGGEAPDMGPLPRPRFRPTWDEIDQANQAAAAAAEKAKRGSSGAAVAFYGEVVVSWESAQPMRLIRKPELPPEFKDHYVIRVTGLPDLVLKSIEAPELRKASLEIASKKRIAADLAQVKRPEYIEFGFRSPAIPLSTADRSVKFAMSLGQMSIQALFDLPRMMFRNSLAL